MNRLARWLLPALILAAALASLRGLPPPAVRADRPGAYPGILSAEGRARIDLNRADEALLAAIPGVGPVLAARIRAFIEEKGALTAPGELMEVDGIGPKKLIEIERMTAVRP